MYSKVDIQEGPNWVCFGDAQSLLSGGRQNCQIHMAAEPSVLYFTSSAPKMVYPR